MSGIDSRSLLVADADGDAAFVLEQAFGEGGPSIEHCTSLPELMRALETRDAEAVFLAESLANQEPNWVRKFVQRFPDVPVVLMVAAGTSVDPRWVSAGAADFVRLPIDHEEALFTVRKLRCLANVESPEEAPSFASSSRIVVQSAAMREVFSLVERVAQGTSTVMIRGESGTGKEVVARRIHEQSPRASGP